MGDAARRDGAGPRGRRRRPARRSQAGRRRGRERELPSSTHDRDPARLRASTPSAQSTRSRAPRRPPQGSARRQSPPRARGAVTKRKRHSNGVPLTRDTAAACRTERGRAAVRHARGPPGTLDSTEDAANRCAGDSRAEAPPRPPRGDWGGVPGWIGANAETRAAQGSGAPPAGRLRSEPFLCAVHETLRFTKLIGGSSVLHHNTDLGIHHSGLCACRHLRNRPSVKMFLNPDWFPRSGCADPDRRADRHKRNHDNDPAAGSPTATLLRLLLPLIEGHWPNSATARRRSAGAAS